MSALARFSDGTQRLVPPEQTLARVGPHLARHGITRCMPVTRLDALGIPTFCAIRPNGLLLQVSNGKGISDMAARVSALMEAFELNHAENPPASALRRTTLAALRAEGARVIAPQDVHGFRDTYFSERYVCDWIEGEDLVRGGPVWAPASGVYFYCTPCLHDTSTNGLASGNHPAEATLHALYELIERDAMTRLNIDGTIRIRGHASVIDPDTIDDALVRAIVDQVEEAGTRVLLLWLPSAIAVHTFWAVMINRSPMASVSTLNIGWGTHVDMRIAACRALTEAAQSRLVFIHGAREDILAKQVYHAKQTLDSAAVRYFHDLPADTTWSDIEGRPSVGGHEDLDLLLSRVVGALADAGHDRLIRFDLTDPEAGIPVVKVIAPTLKFDHKLF
jgi:ribosomal protein S12 methylthiotransferase accessory factor